MHCIASRARMIGEADAEVAKAKASQEQIQGYALATRDRQIAYIQNVANAESAGKPQSEQQLIALKAAGDIQKAKDEYVATIENSGIDVDRSRSPGRGVCDGSRQETEAQRQFNLEMEHTISLQSRWADLKSVSDKTDQDRFKEAQRAALLTDPRLAGTDIQAALQAIREGGWARSG